MATAFPGALDAFVNPTAVSNMSDPTVLHHVQHANLNDAVAALQAKIGANGSAVAGTLTKRIADVEVAGTVDAVARTAASTAQTTADSKAAISHGHSVAAISGAQAFLVSGANIKTVGGVSILGSGDIPVAGGTTSISTAFSQSVLLDDNRTMGTYTQASALAFTLSGAAVANASNRVTIIPDGVSAITFPGFTQASGGDVFAAGFRMTAIFYAIDALSPKYLWDKGAAVTTAPGQVTGLTLGAATVTTQPLTWTAPASNGGSAITDYLIEYKLAAAATYTAFTHAASTTTGIVVTGLTASNSYNFRVSAINANGPGTASAVGTASTAASGTLSYTTYAALSEDVTAAGYQDYVNFTGGGVGATNTFVKNGVGLIGALSGVNLTWAGGVGSFTISGTDGSPAAVFSGSGTVRGALTTVASIGYFEISLPAGIAVRHARCQVSTYNANFAMLPVLRAHLSDSSALDLDAPIPSVVSYGVTESGINISYSAASLGQTLRLRFELPANADASANLQIQLVTYQ